MKFSSTLLRTLILLVLILLSGCGFYNPFLNNKTQTSCSYWSPTFAPDGRIVAYKYVEERKSSGIVQGDVVSTKEYIVIMDQDGTNEQTIATIDTRPIQFEVSPSMNYVVGLSSKFRVWNMNTGELLNTFVIEGTEPNDFDWSPDEKWLVISNASDSWLRVYNPFTNELVKDLEKRANHVVWKYKEKIAFLDGTDPEDIYISFILPNGEGYVTVNREGYNFRPEGYHISEPYLYAFAGGLSRLNLETLEKDEPLYAFGSNYYPKAISQDGTKILYTGSNGQGIVIRNSDGTNEIDIDTKLVNGG